MSGREGRKKHGYFRQGQSDCGNHEAGLGFALSPAGKAQAMAKEQRSTKEKKKPKQDENAKAAKPLTAYAASKAGKK
jgi:hypothetical protein